MKLIVGIVVAVCVVLFVLVLGHVLLGVLSDLRGTTLDELQIRAALRVTSLLLGWGAVALYATFVALVIRGLWRNRGAGTGPAAFLITFAILAVFFSDAAIALVRTPIFLGIRLMEVATAAPSESTPDFNGSLNVSAFTDMLVALLQRMGGAITNEVRQAFFSLPLKDIVLAIGCWALLLPLVAVQGTTGTQSGLLAWWAKLPAERRRSHSIMLLLLVGTYLSIAAIISIPWLADDDEAKVLTKEQVTRLLQGAVLTDQSLAPLQLDTIPMQAALARLRAYVDSLRNVPEVAQMSRVTGRLSEVRIGVDQARADVRLAASALPKFRQQILDEQQRLLGRALEGYERETSLQMVPAERAVYVRDLSTWLRSASSGLAPQISYVGLASDRMRDEVESWTGLQREQLQQAIELERASKTDSLAQYQDFLGPSDLRSIGAFRALLVLPASYSVEPRPPDPGSSWGPFGWVARWLLRTRSVDLAQIAGMLGFGLFGAAVGVRGTAPASKDQAAMSDVGTVLVRGFAATLVVFLSVNGGLAILGQGDSKPNSYVLFFACFLGAVYSDSVWKWAKGQLEKMLPPPQDVPRPGGAPGTAARQPQTGTTIPGTGPKTTGAAAAGSSTKTPAAAPQESDKDAMTTDAATALEAAKDSTETEGGKQPE